jgi:hypothetical protein
MGRGRLVHRVGPKGTVVFAVTSETVDSLILDLLEWVGPEPRPYDEVLDAWRTSCPRLPVWEDANDRGFLERRHEPGTGDVVAVSDRGREHLRANRRPASSTGASRRSRPGGSAVRTGRGP